jgi:hypothetical protein
MDRCQFSEFSYGYCLTEDLIVGQDTPLTAAPVFPSLIEEGQTGAGYDVRFDRPGVPLFLQFKLVHQMIRGTANEAKSGHFQPPFYRMHLRPRSLSDQHESLLSLEQAGNDVFYAAPSFHTLSDLNIFYAQRHVWNQTFKIQPSLIGSLPNDKPHHVTFQQPGGTWQFYSEEPSKKGRAPSTEEINEILTRKITERGKRGLREQLPELDASIQRVVEERNISRRQRDRVDVHELREVVDPLRRVAYLARQFFDCQLLWLSIR